MKLIKWLGGIICLTIFSCTNNIDKNRTILEYDILENATPLHRHDAWYPIDSIYSNRFYVYADSILIIENKRQAGHYFDIYNMKNKELITSCLKFGEGPEECLFAQVYFEGDKLRVTDFIKRRFAYLDIYKILTNKLKPEYIKYPMDLQITSSPVKFGDSIIAVNPYHYVNNMADIRQMPGRFIIKTSKNFSEPMFIDYKFTTLNVGQGFIGANIKKRKLFFASGESPIIEFYDSDLVLKKEVYGPETVAEANLYITTEKYGKHVSYKGGWPETYRNFTYDDNYIYMVYTGIYRTIENANTAYQSYIICFDWDGNLHKTYIAPMQIEALSVSHNNDDTFYASVIDSEGNPELIRLSLNK